MKLGWEKLSDSFKRESRHRERQVQLLDSLDVVSLLELVNVLELRLGSGPVGMILDVFGADLKSHMLRLGVDEVLEDEEREDKSDDNRLPILSCHAVEFFLYI